MKHHDDDNDQPTNGRPSKVLPTDTFDLTLSSLLGLPGGAHTSPTVVQSIDWYGNVSSFMLQVVKTDKGETAFVTEVNAAGSRRFILPAVVLQTLDRQRASCTHQVRRRHGKRLAEERAATGSPMGGFTPAMRAKALQTRQRKAAARRARKAVR